LGIGDWGLGPIPNPQSPIPKYVSINIYFYNNKCNKLSILLLINITIIIIKIIIIKLKII